MKWIVYLQVLFCNLTFAQVELYFSPKNLGNSIVINQDINIKTDTFKIENLKFYISGIELKRGTKTVFKEKNSFHLIDFSDSSTTRISLTEKKLHFTHIEFQIGIDSVTSVSGVYGGDLDPTKGMYWTWQTGYIHFKLEGKRNSKTNYEYHLGGYQFPNNTCKKVSLETKSKNKVLIDLQLDKLFEYVLSINENKIMSPGKDANEMTSFLINCFQINQQ